MNKLLNAARQVVETWGQATPEGANAPLEEARTAGARKKVIVYMPEELGNQEPELMYLMTDQIVVTPHELIEALKK